MQSVGARYAVERAAAVRAASTEDWQAYATLTRP
jgi:hypothetical protein